MIVWGFIVALGLAMLWLANVIEKHWYGDDGW